MGKTFKPKTENNNLWAGLGTQYTSISQVVNEFIDNSISNFKGHSSLPSNSIIITLEELDASQVKISIEDSGTGISDFSNAFGLGAKASQDSPLNEHGFGMKQAFAAANPSNDNWKLCTRTDESSGTFDEVCAPYLFDQEMKIDDTGTAWPGQLNSTGTYIEFVCKREFFKTVARTLRGDFTKFSTLSALLFEDLCFTYARVLENISISIKLLVKEQGKPCKSYP